MRGPGRDDLAIQRHEPCPILVLLRIEDGGASRTAGARSRKRPLDRRRATKELRARRDVERVETLKVRAGPVLGHRHDVDRAIRTTRSIDDRRRRDADFWRDLRAAPGIAR